MSKTPTTIAIDSRIRIPKPGLPRELLAQIREDFTHKNPDHEREKQRRRAGGPGYGPLPPDRVSTWREEGDTLTLPRGGAARVRDAFAEHGVPIRWDDRRSSGVGDGPKEAKLASHIVPEPFQLEMVEKALEVENCLLRGPTGCGKTIVAELLALRLGVPVLVVVPARQIFDQWVKRLGEELCLERDQIGIVSGSKERLRPITVAMVQTLSKRIARYRGVFGALIFDEVHRAAAATFYPAIDGSDARYRIGISADERRKDRREFLVYDLFGRVAANVDRKKLIERGTILDTEIRVVPTEFEADWYADLGPDEKQNPEHFTRLLAEMIADERRNRIAIDFALEEMRAGRSTLLFSHRVEHCERLRADVAAEDHRVGLIVGDGVHRAESVETLEGMRSGELLAAVGTYQSIGTGIDLPSVERGIAITPIHTNRPFFGQVRGRICRRDRKEGATKRDSALYYLWDRRVHGASPLRNLVAWNGGNVRVLEAGVWRSGREVLREIDDAKEQDRNLDLLFGAGEDR